MLGHHARGKVVIAVSVVVPMSGGLRFRLLVRRLKHRIPTRSATATVPPRCSHCSTTTSARTSFFVGGRYTIADIAIYGYTHPPHEAGLEMQP
jgi:hypothetical protein